MIVFAICFYIIGLTVFYTWGQINNGWQDWYYFWDKCKDLLLFTGIYLVAVKRYRWAILPVVIFSLIRLVWQIISSFTGMNINNTQAVGILFIILALISSYLTLKELIGWRK